MAHIPLEVDTGTFVLVIPHHVIIVKIIIITATLVTILLLLLFIYFFVGLVNIWMLRQKLFLLEKHSLLFDTFNVCILYINIMCYSSGENIRRDVVVSQPFSCCVEHAKILSVWPKINYGHAVFFFFRIGWLIRVLYKNHQ